MATQRSQTEEQWDNLLTQSMGALKTFLEEDTVNPQALARVKVATSFISSYTRHEATESSKEQTRFMIGRQVSQTPEDFRRFAALSLPRIQLPAPPSDTDGIAKEEDLDAKTPKATATAE